MGQLVRRYYQREHYTTLFSPQTGFFARIEEPGYPEPFWSEHGPELIDISITNWCDRDCMSCYRSAGPNGRHMSMADYRMIMGHAAKLDVCQVALGGGNPNQHPNFADILKITREEFGIVPNYTTNGNGLTDRVLEATARYCGAVAVSAYEPYGDLWTAAARLMSFGIKTNVHFVLDSITVDTAIEWLLHPPASLLALNAVIFLNYKAVGRGSDPKRLLRQSDRCQEFLRHALKKHPPFKIGFDSCMVSGVAVSAKADRISYDACEAARFSMYISETLQAYPCSFMESTSEGISLTGGNLLGIWQDSPLFRDFRQRLSQPACGSCEALDLCKGGCPVFPDINLCLEGDNSKVETESKTGADLSVAR
jgi:radical SAM protein with 4Fe4S-binding SPASM domain